MDKLVEKKIVYQGKYEDVISINDHFYIISKKQKVCVLPYTISSKGLLDKIGVLKEINIITDRYDYTLINGYVSEDDGTNLVTANRLMYEIIGSNVKKADLWMYLGNVYNKMTSDSEVKLYCVNLTDVSIVEDDEIKEIKKERKFAMVDSNKVVTSDDTLFLAAYLRLLNFFYVNSLK